MGQKDKFHKEVGMKDSQLKPEYLDTFFKGPIPQGGWPDYYAIVTACNPDGQDVDDATNRKATHALEETIDERGVRYGPMTGGSVDGGHQEFGYLVECDLTSALKLGADYKQEAIFWIEDGNLFVVNCPDGSNKQFVDTWEARYKGADPCPPS
jgi:hypothetical protein